MAESESADTKLPDNPDSAGAYVEGLGLAGRMVLLGDDEEEAGAGTSDEFSIEAL